MYKPFWLRCEIGAGWRPKVPWQWVRKTGSVGGWWSPGRSTSPRKSRWRSDACDNGRSRARANCTRLRGPRAEPGPGSRKRHRRERQPSPTSRCRSPARSNRGPGCICGSKIIRQSHEGFRPFRSRFASISRLFYKDGEDWRSLEGFRIGKTRDQCMNFAFEIPCISNFVFFLSLSFFSFLEIIARTRSLGRF